MNRQSGENSNLVVGRLARIFVSNGITDGALSGLEDFFDLSFTVGDVVVRTADGSVFNEVSGLSERKFRSLRLSMDWAGRTLNWASEIGIIAVEGGFVDWFGLVAAVVGGEGTSLAGRCL